MTNNTDKERWIEDVLNSTKGMRRASPGAALFAGIATENAMRLSAKARPIPGKLWAAAAAILLALNIGSVIYYNQHRAVSNNQNPFAAAMQMETTYDY